MIRLTLGEILRLRSATTQNDKLWTVLCKLNHYLAVARLVVTRVTVYISDARHVNVFITIVIK